MKALKSAVLSTLLVAGSFAYQKPTHASDANLQAEWKNYAFYSKSYYDTLLSLVNLNPIQAHLAAEPYRRNAEIKAYVVFSYLDLYNQAVSEDRGYCQTALENYAFMANYALYNNLGFYVADFFNSDRFNQQRTLTNFYCSN